jgi:hypothetical protein
MAQVDNIYYPTNQTHRYLDKFSLFIGDTGSGKTTLVVDALHAVKDNMHDFNVICPATTDYIYRSMELDDKLYNTFSVEDMNKLYDRIESRAAIATLCNTQSILDNLCRKLDIDPTKLDALDKWVITDNNDDDKPQYVFHNAKDVVCENIKTLSNLELSAVERAVVENIKMNPRVCIVFDDSAELFNHLYYNSNFRKLVWNVHKLHVTLLVTGHNHTAFNHLTNSAHNLVFTNESAAQSFINKKHNGMDEYERRQALMIFANHSWTNYRKFALVPTVYDTQPHWQSSTALAKVHDSFIL